MPSVLALCSMSPAGAAATTAYSRPVARRLRLNRRDLQTAGEAGAGCPARSPARRRGRAAARPGVDERGQPVGRHRRRTDAALGIEDLDDRDAADRHRVGHAARVDEQGHLWALARAGPRWSDRARR